MGDRFNLLLVQHGDYLEALQSREKKLPEPYRAQYYSLDIVDQIVKDQSCTVICVDPVGKKTYDTHFKNYHLIMDHFVPNKGSFAYFFQIQKMKKKLIDLVEKVNPTHIIARTSGWHTYVLVKWAIENNIPILPSMVDYFPRERLKDRLFYKSFSQLLNNPNISVVSNYNYPACYSMAEFGVKPDKIVPWQWPSFYHPKDEKEKSFDKLGKPIKLVYVGLIDVQKGIETLIEATEMMDLQGYPIQTSIYGTGKDEEYLKRIGDHISISFEGLVPNERVRKIMRDAHFVIVPSLPIYDEGMPCVIYESLEVRTPVICSNHPCFVQMLKDHVGCRIFEAGNPESLVETLQSVIVHPKQYLELSKSTLEAWEKINCPLVWGDTLNDWIESTITGEKPKQLQYSLSCRKS